MIYWIHRVFTSCQIYSGFTCPSIWDDDLCDVCDSVNQDKKPPRNLFNVQEISSTEHQITNLSLKMTCYRLAPPSCMIQELLGCLPAGSALSSSLLRTATK